MSDKAKEIEAQAAEVHARNMLKAAELGTYTLTKMDKALTALDPPTTAQGISALAQTATQLFKMSEGATLNTARKVEKRKGAVSVKAALEHTSVQQVNTPST